MIWFRSLICMTCLAFSMEGKAESFEIKCFTYQKNKDAPINVKLSTMFVPVDKYRIGYVKYEKSKEPILLFFAGETEREFEEGRPFEVTTKWIEILKGEAGGEYIVISQGAVIYGFSYHSRSGKIFDFKYNSTATHAGQGDCDWKAVDF